MVCIDLLRQLNHTMMLRILLYHTNTHFVCSLPHHDAAHLIIPHRHFINKFISFTLPHQTPVWLRLTSCVRIHTRTCDRVVSFMFVAKLSSTSSFSPTLTQRQHFAPCGHSQPSSCHARINFSSPRHITASHAIAALPRASYHTDSKNKFFSCNKITARRCAAQHSLRVATWVAAHQIYFLYASKNSSTELFTAHSASPTLRTLRALATLDSESVKNLPHRVCDSANLMTWCSACRTSEPSQPCGPLRSPFPGF